MSAVGYTQIGVDLSLFSGKTRAYLLHKGIPFVERGSNPWEYFHTIPKHTQAAAVPVVITPEGEWLQDSSVIIDELEKRFPDTPVLPGTPVLRFAAYLFELWGDEFWMPVAMHMRWSHPENEALFIHDAGDGLMPGMPRWLKNLLGRNHARLMRTLAANVGVRPNQRQLLDRFTQQQLDALNEHFAHHAFLFGDRPSLGDYGLIAPLYAHLGRDPWPKRELIEPRPHLKAWITRMFEPASARGGFFLDDCLPNTLMPALRSIFEEMIPLLAACAAEMRKTPIVRADCRKAIRYLPEVAHPLAGGSFRREGLSYPVWMAQRMLDAYRQMTDHDASAVRKWLQSVGGDAVLALDLPRVRRIGLAAGRIA